MKIKSFLLIILSIALLMSFAACSNTAPSNQDGNGDGGNDEDAADFAPDLAAMRDQMISKFGGEDPISFESDVLLDLYGIAASDIAESACYMTMDGVFPQEIIMIKAQNEDALARISASLENRINEVKIQSESYDPQNYALAQKCKVASKGLYVTMFLSPHFEEMTETFNSAK